MTPHRILPTDAYKIMTIKTLTRPVVQVLQHTRQPTSPKKNLKNIWRDFFFDYFLTCLSVGLCGLLVGLLAQLVEHCTGIVEVMGSNPVQAWIFSRPYFHYCPSSAHYCEDHFHSQKKYYATMIFPPFFTFAVRRSPFLPLAHSWNGRPQCGERIDSFISKIHARKL